MSRIRITIRLRFALAAAGLFVLAGLALVTINYALVRSSIGPTIVEEAREVPAPPQPATPADSSTFIAVNEQADELSRRLRNATLRALLSRSGVALSVATVGCFALAWLVAGRFLRPVRHLTTTAKEFSEQTLHRRIQLRGPNDELKEMADTFDAMLERLDRAFEARGRFVANASHELRTPLAIARTAVEVLERKDAPTSEQVRSAIGKVRAATIRSERLVEGLLLLARSEAGLGKVKRVDLSEVAADVVRDAAAPARAADVEVRTRASSAMVDGDPLLLERMLGNLVENGIRYNRQGGSLEVAVDGEGPCWRVWVSNTGPEVEAEAVDGLFEPFRRGGTERVSSRDGAGLGLSIVRSIAVAHGGWATAQPRGGGGLEVTVLIPRSPALEDR